MNILRIRPGAAALTAIASLLLAPAAGATSVLFVGNSFTYSDGNAGTYYNSANVTDANGTGYGGVPGIFQKLSTEGGFTGVQVTIEAVGGQTLEYHNSSKATIIGGKSWDDVVLQEYSTRPLTSPSGDSNGTNVPGFLTAVTNLDNRVLAKNSAANVFLYETWARPDKINAGYFPNLQAMQNQLHSSYYTANSNSQLKGVAPVGDAFLQAVTLKLANDPTTAANEGPITLWNPDNYHASVYGSYLSASIFYAQILGGDPRTLPTGAGSAAAALGLNAAYADQLQNLAYAEAFPVPEPSTGVLAAVGVAGWWFGRRRIARKGS